jgi:hypothetical protein
MFFCRAIVQTIVFLYIAFSSCLPPLKQFACRDLIQRRGKRLVPNHPAHYLIESFFQLAHVASIADFI